MTPSARSRLPFSLEDATHLLARTPSTLDAMLRDLPERWLGANEGDQTWTPFDVVGHLIHGERTDWIARIRLILEHGDAQPFAPFDRSAQFAESKGKTVGELLATFAEARRANLSAVAAMNLRESDLDKRGRHPSLGPVTLRNLFATWVAHDFDHVMQISRVLAGQYADEVGPWRAYLRIINGVGS